MDFRQIIQKSERKYIFLILILCFLHSLQSYLYTCFPFIFFDPVLQCHFPSNSTTFICDQNKACDQYPYEINYEASSHSLTTEFELICARRFIKPTVQSLILAGTTISGLTMSFVKVNPYKRPKIMMICYLIGAITSIISSFMSNIWVITILLFFSYLFSYVWYANIYTYTSEVFQPPLKKIVPSILASSFGIGTMFFSMMTLLFDNWRYFMAFYFGTPTIFFVFLFYFYEKKYSFEPKNIEIEKEELKIQQNGDSQKVSLGFFAAFKEKRLYKNVLIYIFLWIMNTLSYSGCDIALGSFGSNLAYTMFFLGTVQAICSLISGNLILKFQDEVLLKITTVFMAFFFLLFLFEPQNKLNIETYISVLFTICIVVANIGIELNWVILVNLLQKYIPLQFQQNVFAFGDMCAMIFTLILPYYIEFMLFLSISPIFGFGLLALGGRVVISFLVKVESFEEKTNNKQNTSNEEINEKPIKLELEHDKQIDYQLLDE